MAQPFPGRLDDAPGKAPGPGRDAGQLGQAVAKLTVALVACSGARQMDRAAAGSVQGLPRSAGRPR